MGVEYELKFKANPECQAAIRAAFPDGWQSITMETTYYDTPDGSLAALRYTLRRRFENGVSVCTVKTPGNGAGRGEWEVNCETIEEAIEKLCKLGAPITLLELTQKELLPVCGARFTRQARMLEIPGGTAELALDRGVLFAGEREAPICEVEVEMKSGSQQATDQFARFLAQKFQLRPEHKSKFKRAKALREE